jgi:hypothetical protein
MQQLQAIEDRIAQTVEQIDIMEVSGYAAGKADGAGKAQAVGSRL